MGLLLERNRRRTRDGFQQRHITEEDDVRNKGKRRKLREEKSKETLTQGLELVAKLIDQTKDLRPQHGAQKR